MTAYEHDPQPEWEIVYSEPGGWQHVTATVRADTIDEALDIAREYVEQQGGAPMTGDTFVGADGVVYYVDETSDGPDWGVISVTPMTRPDGAEDDWEDYASEYGWECIVRRVRAQ